MERLRYKEIVYLLLSGKEDEIPKGYNILWRGLPPQKLFEGEVPKEKITVTGNCLPPPTKVIFKAEITPIPISEVFGFGYLDYGDVVVPTQVAFKEIIFVYDESDLGINWHELMEYIRKGAEAVTGRQVKKSDICFNAVIELEDMRFNIYNAFGCNINFSDLGTTDETNGTIPTVTMKIAYDYVTAEFKDN